MQLLKTINKKPVLIGYLVKKLIEEYPSNQIGKTKAQKMVFLLTQKDITKEIPVDFDYSMHYYGPYSAEVSSELDNAESMKIVNIKWIENKGFYIRPGTEIGKYESILTEDEKMAVDNIVDKFGDSSITDLSIIATALFLKNNFNLSHERIVNIISKSKNQPLLYIRNVLKKSEVNF